MTASCVYPYPFARKAIHLSCLLAWGIAVPAVHAADAPDDAPAEVPRVVVTGAATEGTLADRTSTGSYLDLSRLDTPASLDVLTRKQLDERGDVDLTAAIVRAPGLSSLPHPGNSGSSLAARGFTDTTSVMRLYDGLRQYGGAGLSFPFDTWAVERIEVLRGPASVLYGEGAIGGVVNVVPKQPTRGAVQNAVQAMLGTEGTRRVAFGSGGAIDGRWAYRVDASADRSDGWVDRGDSRNRAFSGALRFDVSPDLYLKLALAWGHQQPMRYFGTPLVDGSQLEALRDKNYNVADAVIDYRDRWIGLDANWRASDAVTVRTRFYRIDSNRHWRNAESYVYDPATRLVERADDTEILHDQAQNGNTTSATYQGSLFGLKHQVAAGFDVSSSSFTHTNNTYVGSPGPVDLFDPVPGLFASSVPTIPRYRTRARQYALFAEDRLELAPRWSVLGGVRYDHATLARTDLVAGRQAYDRTFADTGWRVGTVWEARPGLALYAQYARAADPVGALLFLSPANSRFQNATGRQVEAGVKQELPGRRGEWTVAVYDIAKDNLLTRDPANPAQSIQVGRRSSRGIEGTLNLALAPGWSLDANAALLRARFDDFVESVAGVPVSRAGNVPTDVPRRLANLWLHWQPLPAWSASAGLRHVGERFADNANRLRMPAYTTADLSLRWKLAAQTSLTLHGANLFDKRYYATAYYTPTQWLVGPDRRVELVLDHRF
ncbi:TonB-dependent siderophore receptor [uncultured Massilia sp.]|uniref:TonB-dependent receptor n=1 Tax=uncultured Massilia sp. TaxID=169973 RepID=UPI0025D183BE|nr:TonB-dependent receptor [uncultured Massilia sp.]